MKKRVLIIPDAVMSDASGAVVAQVVRDQLVEMGHVVGVFSSDIDNDFDSEGVSYYNSIAYSGSSNFKSGVYKKRCMQVYDGFRPDVVLILGSITNKPVCYIEEAIKRGYVVSVFIFMQDFFCSKVYANDANGPCTKCLDNGLCSAFKNTCGVRSQLGFIRLAQRVITRKMWKRLLPKVNHVATTTREQMSFYERFGIPKEKHSILYLPFASNKLNGLNPERGDYFIGIAQDRVEKGFQFVPRILEHTSCKVILAYSNEDKVRQVSQTPELQKFLETGQLKLVVSSWKTDLGEMIAKSCGVIIPSIWPTTTEYGWLEAMSLSKPVCCFDISVHHEFIEQGVNGFVSSLNDFEAFAKNMDVLMSLNDNDYITVAKQSRSLFERLTDATTLTKQLSCLLMS